MRSNFAWMLASNIIFGGCQFAMLSVLAKLGTTRMVGEFTLALAITAPIFLFANLNLNSVLATDVRREYRFGDYLGLRLMMIGAALLVFIGIILPAVHYRSEMGIVLALVMVARVFDSLSDIIYGLLQQRERMARMAVSRIIQGITQLIILAAAVYWTGSLIWAMAALAVGSGLITFTYDVKSALMFAEARSVAMEEYSSIERVGDKVNPFSLPALQTIKPIWARDRLVQLVRLTAPLGFVGVLGLLIQFIPRYFIERYAGTSDVGIFSAMWSLVHPLATVMTTMYQAIQPRMARAYIGNMRQFETLFLCLLALGVLFGAIGLIGAGFCGRLILTILYRPAYARYPVVFFWIMAGAAVYIIASACQCAILASRYFKVQTICYVFGALCTFVACLWLIPHGGLPGAAWAYFIGNLAWMLSSAVFVGVAVVKGRRNAVRLKGELL